MKSEQGQAGAQVTPDSGQPVVAKMPRGIARMEVRWELPAVSALGQNDLLCLWRVGEVGLTLGSGQPCGVKSLSDESGGCDQCAGGVEQGEGQVWGKKMAVGLWLSRERARCASGRTEVVVVSGLWNPWLAVFL